MLRSMTAYSRASLTTSLGHFTAEIQSVNRKHLEVNAFLPKELLRFDSEIKKMLNDQVSRGQINLKIFATFDQQAPVVVIPNLPLVRQMKAAWDQIAKELNLDAGRGFTLEMLADQEDVLLYEENLQDEELYRLAIKNVVELALKDLIEMKIREGVALQQDISLRLNNLRRCIGLIADKTPGATQKYRQKLIERLEELLSGCVENEERILREVAVFAEKIDISEELTRFQSHLDQINALLEGSASSVGKTLEFFLQELNREANTVGSKSSDVEISRLVIEIKSELEKIREQIQNVE